jgi:hypothetical protein
VRRDRLHQDEFIKLTLMSRQQKYSKGLIDKYQMDAKYCQKKIWMLIKKPRK